MSERNAGCNTWTNPPWILPVRGWFIYLSPQPSQFEAACQGGLYVAPLYCAPSLLSCKAAWGYFCIAVPSERSVNPSYRRDGAGGSSSSMWCMQRGTGWTLIEHATCLSLWIGGRWGVRGGVTHYKGKLEARLPFIPLFIYLSEELPEIHPN